MTPTVGQSVVYALQGSGEPRDAVIVHVHNAHTIDLEKVNPDGSRTRLTRVVFGTGPGLWAWPDPSPPRQTPPPAPAAPAAPASKAPRRRRPKKKAP